MTAAKEKRKDACLSAANERKRKYEEQASTSQEVTSSTGDRYFDDEDETFQQPSEH